jgi:endonuclease-3
MSSKSPEEIYSIIKPCGLGPQKSKAIHRLSNILCNSYDGKVPEDIKALEKLPGVGHKTASVVISQGFGHPAFPVDTHIHRLAQRWGLTKGKNVQQTEKDLKKVFPKDSWNKLHLQIIFWGREFCQAQKCHGITCKICKATFPKRSRPFSHNKP